VNVIQINSDVFDLWLTLFVNGVVYSNSIFLCFGV
jgi:hypothetical protein